jgi:hypothetical protein
MFMSPWHARPSRRRTEHKGSTGRARPIPWLDWRDCVILRPGATGLDRNVPGDMIETGVWPGGCCILMKGILRSNLDKDRKVYVADSFAGLPPPDPVKYKDPTDDPHHTLNEFVVPVEQVKKNFQAYDLLNDNVIFDDYVARVRRTRLQLDPARRRHVRVNDRSLQNLYPKLSRGGYISSMIMALYRAAARP